MKKILLENLWHRFDQEYVLKNINFSIEAGEVLVIMGSSGGGKSTLLKCLSGLLFPTKGIVKIDQIAVTESSESSNKFGFVFQYAALFDSLTVGENILFGIKRKEKIKKKEDSQLINMLLNSVSLNNISNMFPSELSGGMQKRVGLARALAMNPEVLFYDEPTSGLDPITAYSIDQLICKTNRSRKITSVVVTHDVNSAVRIADRILFLEKGSVVFLGTPQEFLKAENPEICNLIEASESKVLN